MPELILGLSLPAVLAGAVQFALLRLTRARRPLRRLRWLVPLASLIPFALAWAAWNEGGMLFIGLNQLAALAWVLVGGCILLGWGLGWAVFALSERRKK